MSDGRSLRIAVAEKRRLALNAQPLTVRFCLCCDQAFRSTGYDHRLCNLCKGEPTGRSLVGARLMRVRGGYLADVVEVDL